MKSLYAADIRDNQSVDGLFLVAAKNHGLTKGGNSYLTLKLLDRSGEIEARVWERADDLARGIESRRGRFSAKERLRAGRHAGRTSGNSPHHQKPASPGSRRSLFR